MTGDRKGHLKGEINARRTGLLPSARVPARPETSKEVKGTLWPRALPRGLLSAQALLWVPHLHQQLEALANAHLSYQHYRLRTAVAEEARPLPVFP